MTLDALSRRRRIEEVASALFRERGYAGTSIRDIARSLDIQGASVYAHVASKEDVLWAIVDRAATRFEEAAEATTLATEGTSATERFAALVRAHVSVVTADVGEASVFVHEWRALGEERREQIALRRDAYPIGVIYKRESKPSILDEQAILRGRFPQDPQPREDAVDSGDADVIQCLNPLPHHPGAHGCLLGNGDVGCSRRNDECVLLASLRLGLVCRNRPGDLMVVRFRHGPSHRAIDVTIRTGHEEGAAR